MDFEVEYSERFDHRRKRNIENLSEIAHLAHHGGADTLKVLPSLVTSRVSDEAVDALRWSILMLWLEAIECYVLGQFEACILVCGTVVERCLKLEYQEVKGHLPKGKWTLGRCIHKLDWSDTRITSEQLDPAKEILDPRNSRAHALLEHEEPQVSILGGNRGIEFLDGSRYSIEPYREDASQVVKHTWEILSSLYSSE